MSISEKVDISIVIPFHNEEEALKRLLPQLKNVIRNQNKKFEIILIDDVSCDGSVKVVKSFQSKIPEIKLLKLKNRGGQTGCYKKAFSIARGKYIVRMDADLQDDPRDLPKFIEKIDQGSELIMGLREARKHSRMIRFAAAVYDMLILLLFNSPLHSNTGSYVAFKTTLVKNIPFRKNDHRYIPLIVMRRGAKDVSEVLVRHNERKYGTSKYQPFKKIIMGIPELFLFLLRFLRGVYD